MPRSKDDGDAERFAEIFRPEQITREAEWASEAWARMDGATLRRIADTLGGVRLTIKKAKIFATLDRNAIGWNRARSSIRSHSRALAVLASQGTMPPGASTWMHRAQTSIGPLYWRAAS